MAWNEKYWDVINRCYWNPTIIGLKSIPQKQWGKGNNFVSVPRNLVNPDGPLYARKSKAGPNLARLQLGEEPLNDQFNLTFAIAADAIASELLFRKVGIVDLGPLPTFHHRPSAAHEDEFCSHVLVDQPGGSRVRAIEASNDWPIEKLRKSLGRG